MFFCITAVMNIKPRPSHIHKLVLYFPPGELQIKLCWMAFPSMSPPPCTLPCQECIVCEGCHDCRVYDYPLVDALLAAGAGTTVNEIRHSVTRWIKKPHATGTYEHVLLEVFGVKEGEILNRCEKNLSIEKLTGLSSDWRGPFVAAGCAWIDCEGRSGTRDIAMEDLVYLKNYFIRSTRKDLEDTEDAEAEVLEENIMELDAMLSAAMKKNKA